MNLLRQGDVLLRKLPHLPQGAQPLKYQEEARILAHGEKTGHTHQLTNGTVHETPNGQRIVQLDRPARLVHQEHAPIDVSPGIWEVVRQRTYLPPPQRDPQPPTPTGGGWTTQQPDTSTRGRSRRVLD